MKVGDIVSFMSLSTKVTGIVIGFDEDGDPYVLDSETNSVRNEFIAKVDIIHEQ